MDDDSKPLYVIDASFFLCYLMPDEYKNDVQKVFDQLKNGAIGFISTRLLPFEVANGIYAAVLSKRIDNTLAGNLIEDFLQFPVPLEEINYASTLELALKYRRSIYDASYVLLARQNDLPLLTLDKQLKRLSS